MKLVPIENMGDIVKLFGRFDENILILKELLKVGIKCQNSSIEIAGSESNEILAEKVILKLLSLISKGEYIDRVRVQYLVQLAESGDIDEIDSVASDVVAVTHRGKPIKSRTLGQKKYVDLLRKNTIVFGVGPAGTGKTYLAVCHAVACLKRGEVDKIVLTRPAVEAGEKLGFLPGDLQDKVDPYLRPLYDALAEMLGQETYVKMQERGTIEVAPLAYMRGRTLPNSFVILDEAQNTTSEQMKMFLTRLGENSRMVITGDITQIDLPDGKKSGLKVAVDILQDIPDIAIVYMSHKDVVRHALVQSIVQAYEKRQEYKS